MFITSFAKLEGMKFDFSRGIRIFSISFSSPRLVSLPLGYDFKRALDKRVL